MTIWNICLPSTRMHSEETDPTIFLNYRMPDGHRNHLPPPLQELAEGGGGRQSSPQGETGAGNAPVDDPASAVMDRCRPSWR